MEPRADIPGNASAVPRLARLDGLRGIAACVVAGYHLQIFYYNGLSDFFGGVAGWFFRWGGPSSICSS